MTAHHPVPGTNTLLTLPTFTHIPNLKLPLSISTPANDTITFVEIQNKMSATTVHVKGISTQTEDKEIRDFFSFCGKITSLDVKTEGDTKSAEVIFGKIPPTATTLPNVP